MLLDVKKFLLNEMIITGVPFPFEYRYTFSEVGRTLDQRSAIKEGCQSPMLCIEWWSLGRQKWSNWGKLCMWYEFVCAGVRIFKQCVPCSYQMHFLKAISRTAHLEMSNGWGEMMWTLSKKSIFLLSSFWWWFSFTEQVIMQTILSAMRNPTFTL